MVQKVTGLVTFFLVIGSFAYGQSKPSQTDSAQICNVVSLTAAPDEKEQDRSSLLAACAITQLRRLENDVLVYNSFGEFKASGRLARVSLEVFRQNLQNVTAEVEIILAQLPQNRLRTQIANALASYRDGEFGWRKIYTSRVVPVSALNFRETHNPSEAWFLSTVPYTTAIHWRNASKYLKRADALILSSR